MEEKKKQNKKQLLLLLLLYFSIQIEIKINCIKNFQTKIYFI
jgi:hypothetical protein